LDTAEKAVVYYDAKFEIRHQAPTLSNQTGKISNENLSMIVLPCPTKARILSWRMSVENHL